MINMNTIIEEAGLTNFYYKKPIIDGNSICELFKVKPGKIMRPLQEELLKF
jgi:hypothetical protein